MTPEPVRFAYQSMGTSWEITIWDDIDGNTFEDLKNQIIEATHTFDETYSRFKKTSLISSLATKTGNVEVPADLVKILQLYEHLNRLTHGKCNPLVGNTLSDLGYDPEYSLKEKERIRPVPEFSKALTIIDDTHIALHEPVLIDLGALGKGYFVDRIADRMKAKQLKHFLVNGSGDVYYEGNGTALRCGLEHPDDTSKVIGVIELEHGAFCASAGNRRKWGTHHHTIDPRSLLSPSEIFATWVMADNAALADGLATCVFLSKPEPLQDIFTFEYCILNRDYKVKRSSGFKAELF